MALYGGGRYQRITPSPVVVGAELIEQARQIERERTLLEVRRAIEGIPVTKPSGRNSWDRESRRAEDFRTDALNAITGMEVRS